ncbi:zinc finger MYND domain-containing protein 10 [Adelges cooleyi]|uniref:zinc finger MYND domain-containing protein 10 n=1 Tax=Adelges cooleyi TaxID=133065 RepID=UPI0021800BB9|nr:zinc finger MYND domain-containing protein 10 [Adelges cooleyi]
MDVVSQGEVDLFIDCISESKLDELGTKKWFENHDRLQKLNQQATLEATEHREEYIKDQIISRGKVPVLVYEAVCVSLWREKVLPELLRISSNADQSFTVYFVLFHETVAVGLLQKILFHEDGVQALGNNALDLFDHVIMSITHLAIGDSNNFCIGVKMRDAEVKDDIAEQKHRIQFDVGIECIGIMFNMLLHLKSLSLTVAARMTMNNDVPMLICHLLNTKPWVKLEGDKTYTFQDNTWKVKNKIDNQIPKHEAHLWMSLHEFFMAEQLRNNYEITQFRKRNLAQLQNLLNDNILNQISPLINLKQCLYRLTLTDAPTTTKRPLFIEITAEIRPTLLNAYSKRWKKIAKSQVLHLFGNDSHDIAKSLSETYEHIAIFEVQDNVCANCRQPAKNRCSQCKNQWYCSRKCQVGDWQQHKKNCQ